MKKLLLLVLAFAFLLVSCANTTPPADATEDITSAESTSAPVTTEAPKKRFPIADTDAAEFKIVLPENASAEAVSAANEIVKHYLGKLGVRLDVISEGDPKSEHEILLFGARGSVCEQDTWRVATSEGDLIINGSPAVLFLDALSYFIAHTDEFALDRAERIGDSGGAPIYMSGGYTLVWHDEFDGERLDGTKWKKTQQTVNAEATFKGTPEFIYLEDGTLNLDIVSRTEFPLNVSTQDIMAYNKGYIQLCARIPAQSGAWPAFWMQSEENFEGYNPSGTTYLAEIDVFEAFGVNDTVLPTLHKWYIKDKTYEHGSQELSSYTDPTLSSEYHVYGFGWDDTLMWFDVDGVVYATYQYKKFDVGNRGDGMGGFSDDPVYIILDNVGVILENHMRQWPELKADGEYPVNFSIDWIRLYQIPEESSIYYYD